MTGLPANNTDWPPAPHDQVVSACQERQVWWEGDPDKLVAFYARGHGTGASPSGIRQRVRGAIDGFWGRPRPTTGAPKRLHVPVAADIGRIAASTLFSEPVTFSDPAGDKAVQDVIDAILNTNETYSGMLIGAESASMLSGVYGRIVWDKNIRDHTWIDWVDADRAIPTFKWGQLTACTFWTELDGSDDNTVWRHVEHYSTAGKQGRIDHALYKGKRDNIGQAVTLNEHPDTEALIKGLDQNSGYTVPADSGLLVEYMPNWRPNPQWRNAPELKYLGRSDLTRDVLHLLDACDEAWSSLIRDLDLGRGRVFVSDTLLTSTGVGRGTTFDLDQAIFSKVGTASDKGAMTTVMEAQQFDIRVTEHLQIFDGLLRRAISRAGYSPITFGLQDEVAATATEVSAKERDTNSTRSAKTRLWALSRLATTQLHVESAIFNTKSPSEPIQVDWPDTHQESTKQRAETVQLLMQAEAASVETRVRMVNPDWDDEQIMDEVDKIVNDRAPVAVNFPGESEQPPLDGPADDPEGEQPDTDPFPPQ